MKILFIGLGKMAQIFINNFDQHKLVSEFFLFNRTLSKAEALNKNLQSKNSVLKNLDTIPKVDLIFLCIKPQNLHELGDILNSEATLVSMLAGCSVKQLTLQTKITKIIRIMPNTAIAKESGCTTLFFNEHVSDKTKKDLLHLLHHTGENSVLKSEDEIDKVTPINGSTPAIIFELTSYMMDYLKTQNIEEELARKLVTSTILGAAKLMTDSPKSLTDLVNEVTSKGGSTIKALDFYRSNKLNEIIIEGLNESYKRVKELGKS